MSGLRFLTESSGLVYKLYDLTASMSVTVQKRALELLFAFCKAHEDGFRMVHRAAKQFAKKVLK